MGLEAIEQLMNLWNDSDSKSLQQVTAECAKSSNKSLKVVVGQKFDLICEQGHVTIIAIKKKGSASIQGLNLALTGLPQVREIILDGSDIVGDLRDLEAPRDLRRLHLRWCRVSGNLKDLQEYSLEALKLSGDINGSLGDLNWSRLTILDLGNTPGVTGDVPVDRTDSPLKGLWLLGTNVSGDVDQLLRCHAKMVYLYLGGEGFRGKIEDPWRDGLGRNLKELCLKKTGVKFNVPKRQVNIDTLKLPMEDWPVPFYRLSKLDVSGTNLSMDVWDFLHPLANNYYLSEVRARGCSLSGEVRGIFSADNSPLYWQVKLLDLSHNLINGLRGTPRKAMYLDVSNNPKLADVADEYFQQGGPMVLDLQKTNFRMDAEARLRNLRAVQGLARLVVGAALRLVCAWAPLFGAFASGTWHFLSFPGGVFRD